MMSLTVSAGVSIAARMTGTPDLGSTLASLDKSYSSSLIDGALAGMANELYHKQRTLAASASEDLDLAGAVLLDPLGGAASFARIKGLLVYAAAANTNNVVVGAASANQWVGLLGSATCALVVRPGCVVSAFCGGADAVGYVVTAGTGDLLKVANSGGTTGVTYDIILFGTIT